MSGVRSMIVDLNELRLSGEPLIVEGSFDEELLQIESSIASLSKPVQAALRVAISEDFVRIRGSLETELSLTCCRCTGTFSKSIRKDFELEYVPDLEVSEGEEFELKYEDLEVGFYHNDEIDLSAVLSEQIVLEIPMKPVCREDCKGLCDQCGRDLNEGECSCVKTRVDPRLAVLADLMKKKLN